MIKNIVGYIKGLKRAASKVRMASDVSPRKTYEFPIGPPALLPGIVPEGATAPVMAMDYSAAYAFSRETNFAGFPGFPYLSQLSTRAEFRAFAAAMSTELTREWIKFDSKQSDGDESGDKIKKIEDEFKRLNLRNVVREAAEHDCYFGRAQMFIDIKGADRKTPLILDSRTIAKGSLNRICAVEPIWTTPSAYNAIDPAAADFYTPTQWWMLGQEVHASRLLTIITRELPDILKPAFNFGGMSLSQLAEPYVDNWLRTRQSISDLLNNFSITALKTAMSQLLQGEDDGAGVIDRAKLFTAMRSNQGLMLLDKDVEELVQLNVPLSGLHELQAQSQEQMCAVSHTPSTVLLGVAPSGFGNVAEGETQMWRDWISAQQEANWRSPLEVILKVIQLSLFGSIDPDITLSFVPLFQMDPGDLADIRLKDSQAGTAYINAGVIDPTEERERLASDPESGYQGLDVDKEIVPPNQPMENEPEPGKEDKPKPAQDIAQDADNYDDLIRAAGGNPSDFDSNQFARGLKVEQEHFGTTSGNEIQMAGIVLDHLREIPDYYDRLKQMEKAAGIVGDAEFQESEHPRKDNGEFGQGSGGGNASTSASRKVEVAPAFKEFVKKSKSKVVPTKNPPGNMVEIPAGVNESHYEKIISSVEHMTDSKAGVYIKRSIEIGSEDRKYNVSVQMNAKGDIIGACSMHSLPDSIRIETLGGLGKGAGKSCLVSAIRQSIKAGKGGAITLTPLPDLETKKWYIGRGFVEKPNSRYNEYWLSPEAAKRLLA